MSLVTRKLVKCDAPRCEVSVTAPHDPNEPYPIPMHWIRTRTWDMDGPWESREYDACSTGCLLLIQQEADELREEFSKPSEEVWSE